MFSRIIVSSLLLAALANGLVFKRDDGYSSSSTPPALPTVAPEPILLPDPPISMSLPPLDPSPTGTLSSSLLSSSPSPPASVVTKTVYSYPTQCRPNPTGDLATPTQPTPIKLPQVSPLNLPAVRRDDPDSVISQMRDLEQQVMNTYVNLGKGDLMLSVIGQIETLIAQAVAPGADVGALLKQAQDLVETS